MNSNTTLSANGNDVTATWDLGNDYITFAHISGETHEIQVSTINELMGADLKALAAINYTSTICSILYNACCLQ